MKNHKSGKVEVNDINIYYEIHGKGEPLLLVEGLGCSSWMWFKQIPDFSREYKVIVFDNRGVGDTDKPDMEYTMEMMADDAAGVLKALGIESAHVLGVSMGGFIAQEIAINYPDMVKSLALVSTSFSGRDIMHRGSSSLFSTFAGLWELIPAMLEFRGKVNAPMANSFGLTTEKKIRYGLSLAFAPEYFNSHIEEIDRIVEWRLVHPQPLYAWKRQLIAGMKFDATDRAHQIKAPTLVVTGSEDRVVQPESSKRLVEKIPNSRFVEVQGTGHLPFIEQAEEFNKMVLSFLKEVTKDKEAVIIMKEMRKWWRRIVSFFFSY
ncbi:MAG: alpha/beta fold hydrolase [Deltaproteobacteria bacterium]|nr:alpha/beta fold hydrolase [Deltaproteobacteria bacterium]